MSLRESIFSFLRREGAANSWWFWIIWTLFAIFYVIFGMFWVKW